jgi:hypothetical protein
MNDAAILIPKYVATAAQLQKLQVREKPYKIKKALHVTQTPTNNPF